MKILAPSMLVLAAALFGGCASQRHVSSLADTSPLREVVSVEGRQLTGVAVSRSGRVFVNFPRWEGTGGRYELAVAEVASDGSLKPYPSADWNALAAGQTPSDAASPQWVCVQSVHVDADDRLWILDPASPNFAGVLREHGGPKLVEVDLKTDTVQRVITFNEAVAPRDSYLNDVRVDTNTDTAYITDSGLGAIIVVDLQSGLVRRRLADHPSTKADPNYIVTIDGREVRFAGGPNAGKPLIVHSDGLALDLRSPTDGGGYLYWQALTGNKLYRAPLYLLRDERATGFEIEKSVQFVGRTVVTDGMECDAAGNLYFSALERSEVVVRNPAGGLHTLVADPRLAWPDSFAIRPTSFRSTLYVTTSQIHRAAWFVGEGATFPEPFRVLSMPIKD